MYIISSNGLTSYSDIFPYIFIFPMKMAIFRMIHPSNGHHMPLFSNGPAGIISEAATSIHPPGTPCLRRDHHDPRKRRIPKRLSPWVIMVVVGLSIGYIRSKIMSKIPLCPGISMSLLWISLGNFYNYLGFPKMECFGPTDITRPLGPTFSPRPILFLAPAVLSLPSVMSTGTGKNHLQMIGNTWKYKKWLEKS